MYFPNGNQSGRSVLDTELLHLCWLVEETLDYLTFIQYDKILQDIVIEDSPSKDWRLTHATWQQRVITLCKMKGIEI